MGRWYIDKGPESDVVISSRVRLARNFRKYPFPSKLDKEQGGRVLEEVKDAVFNSNSTLAGDVTFIDIKALNPIEKQSLVEKHLISPELAENGRESGLLISRDEKISIMINEEDHLRIQCMFSGMQISDAWKLCNNIDLLLESKIDFAFSRQYGYLTCCPTNIGTGIRASVMLHLPGLVMTGYIKGILEACGKLGVAVRGIYGENSYASGNMFQISNQVTLGQKEDEIVTGVTNIASQIIEQERMLRAELHRQNPYRFEDKIYRSFAVFSSARIISYEESLKLISDVRLGLDMGIIKGISIETLNEIMLLIQPASLQKTAGSVLGPDERDIKRAEIIRNKLKVN
ncbi:protein arginine kinase [Anaerobacterium chartisolvens]|uniref:Protein-arginine kinase n=1 Tax=Anaerobacterium chartisolvens TaxID=1297424 RepID=A0A369ALC8_9FIRM|nr:protein arginine kinase [Anaerobacterium chartisolvens]RCX09981.1 protein arginine kinase [Anaerobacterium chartisolvens]